MCEKLRQLWKPTCCFEVMDVHHQYYMVQFVQKADRERVLTRMQRLIFDHYMSVKPWKKGFVAANLCINTTMVWIHIHDLGLEFYDERIIMTLTLVSLIFSEGNSQGFA